MATSGAMSTTNDNIKYKITITQNSQSIANNTSNVTVSVRVYRTNTGYTTYGTGTVYCTINGTQYTESITSDDKITSSGIVVFSKTLNIAHNADGTKTLATSARISHQQFSSSSQSYSQALTTIPRATTPTLSASSVNMGESITINMPRASSSFDHTLTYKFGSATGTIGSDLGTSKTWTVITSGSVYSLNSSYVAHEILTTESSYDIRLTVTDYFGSVVAYGELPTAFTLLDFNANGRAMAFGKVSELDEGIEFGIPFTGGNIDGEITAAENISFTRFSLTKQGDMVTLYVNAKYAADATAGTTILVATLPDGFIPTGSVATTGVQGTTGTGVAWVRNDAKINFRPATAYTANQVIEFNLHWNVKAIWH